MYHTLTSRTLETSLQVWSTKGLSIAMPAAVTRPSILPNDCTAFSNAVYEFPVLDASDETRCGIRYIRLTVRLASLLTSA